jgi:hypothetical protein
MGVKSRFHSTEEVKSKLVRRNEPGGLAKDGAQCPGGQFSMERNGQDLPGSIGRHSTQLGVTAARRNDLETDSSQGGQHFAS